MIKEIDIYNEYIEKMRLQINQVMEKLYIFKKEDNNTGMNECSDLAQLVMRLGTVSEKLRPYTNNRTPIQYQLIDDWIDIIDVKKLDCLFLTAFLRYTFVAKNGLKNWSKLRDETAIKIDSIGKNSKSLLRGLF
jgi:hypothetical protein